MLILSVGLLMQPATSGDTVTIPGHFSTSEKQLMPRRGINMNAVINRFGEPRIRRGPVGDPPISEWDYGSFRVYFEYQIVLHTVDLKTLVIPR